MILEKTVELIKQIYRYHRIVPPRICRIVVGLGYTGVQIEALAYAPFLGLAQTLPNLIGKSECSKINVAGNLTETSIEDLLQWSLGPPSLEKVIGIATMNALSQHILKIKNPYKKVKQDLIEYLHIEKNTKVIFIGLIKPLIRKISKVTKHITIIENTITISTEFEYFDVISKVEHLKKDEIDADILICTGTALINNTMEEILNLFKRKANFISVIGPSASMIPDVLFDYGVDLLGGMHILDSDSTLRVLQEGGGTKQFKQFGKKYNLTKN